MNESLISVRYATALYSSAREKNIQHEVKQDMELVLDVCNKSADFKRMLYSSIITPSAKIKVIEELFGNRISRLSVNFLIMVINNRRESLMPAMCMDVLNLIRKDNNINTAVITTAKPVEDDTVNRLQHILEDEIGGTIELSLKVNPDIIGGFLLQVEDKQYDATVTTQLQKLKHEFLKS